jgi:hypothetical protein
VFGGDYEAAMSAALPVIEDDPAFTAEAAFPELIEAAIRADQREVATAAYKNPLRTGARRRNVRGIESLNRSYG